MSQNIIRWGTFILGATVVAIGLSGCAPAAAVGGAGSAAVLLPVLAAATGTSVQTLSDVAAAACGVQAAANAAQDINAKWAPTFQEVSKIAGAGCAW